MLENNSVKGYVSQSQFTVIYITLKLSLYRDLYLR